MKPQLIIFDFDGTLADTTESILATFRATIEEGNLPYRADEQCRATIGIPLKEGFRQLYPDFDDRRIAEVVALYRSVYRKTKLLFPPRLYEGVADTLTTISGLGIKMSVASSRSRESLIEFLDQCGITRYFSLILGCEDVAKPKPDPEAVIKTLETLDADGSESLVIGDMPVDITMGRGAGCRTVGVTYGNSDRRALINAGADFIIDRFVDILPRVVFDK